MDNIRLLAATNEELILAVSTLADEIWHEYFPFLLSEDQIDYMVEKFLSFDALKEQIENGYEYFLIIEEYNFVGFVGVHDENGELFLSKLYVHKEFRGNHISSIVFKRLVELAKLRGLHRIWLTCNKHNDHSLEVYRHWGFQTIAEDVTDIGNGYVMDDYILEYRLD